MTFVLELQPLEKNEFFSDLDGFVIENSWREHMDFRFPWQDVHDRSIAA